MSSQVVLPPALEKAKTSLKEEFKIGLVYTGSSLKISANGDALFCSCDNAVKVVSTSTGKVTATFDGDVEAVLSIAVSPDDTMVVVSSRSRMLRVYERLSGECSRSFKAHVGPVMTMDFDKSSTLLATGSADATIKVWDIRKGFCTHNFKGSSGVVSTVKFHPDKLQLFSCATDCLVRWWDLKTSKPLGALKGHNSVVRDLFFVPGMSVMMSGGRDQIVLAWDLKTKKTIATSVVMEAVEALVLLPAGTDFLGRPAVSTDNLYYVTAGDKKEIRVWGYPSGKCFHTEATPAAITSCFLDHATGQLIATTVEQMILFYDLETFSRTRQIVGSYDEVIDVDFLGAAQSHVAVATNTDHIQLLDTRNLDTAMLEGHSGIVMCLRVAPGGLWMASGSKDNSVRIWAAGDDGVWSCVAVGEGHAGDVSAIAVPSKKARLVVSGSKDCTIKVWQLPGAFATGADAAVVPLSARFTRRAHEKDINCISFAPNDRLIVTGSQDRLAKVWRADDGELVGTLKGHKRGVTDACFSPVDQVVATASGDATVKLWSIADLTCIRTFEGHESSILCVKFLTRGTQLITTGSDGLVRLWNIKNSELVETFDGHDGRVWALTVSTDESRFVTGAQDGTITIWRDDTAEKQDLKLQESDHALVMAQDLANLVKSKKWAKAASLALELKQPFQLLKIFSAILRGDDGAGVLERVVAPLPLGSIGTVLEYARDWNTNSRHVKVAQSVITTVLRTTPLSTLAKIPGVGGVVSSLIAYSERHFKRATKLQMQSRLVDYVWTAAKPTGDGNLQQLEDATPEEMGESEPPAAMVVVSESTVEGSADATLEDPDDFDGSEEEEEEEEEEIKPKPATKATKRKAAAPTKSLPKKAKSKKKKADVSEPASTTRRSKRARGAPM